MKNTERDCITVEKLVYFSNLSTSFPVEFDQTVQHSSEKLIFFSNFSKISKFPVI